MLCSYSHLRHVALGVPPWEGAIIHNNANDDCRHRCPIFTLPSVSGFESECDIRTAARARRVLALMNFFGSIERSW